MREVLINWFPTIGVYAVSFLLVYLPGIVIGISLRIKLKYTLFFAPVFSALLVTISAIAFNFIHIKWSWWSALPLAFFILGVSSLKGEKLRIDFKLNTEDKYLLVSWLIGSAIIGYHMLRTILNPKNPALSWDGVFHQNAIRYIIDSGSASPFTISNFLQGRVNVFYPAVFHEFVAQIISLTHTTIPIAYNIFTVFIASQLWICSMLFLIYVLFPKYPAIWSIGTLLAGTFPIFPYALLATGGLLPNILGYSFIPLLVASIYIVVRKPEHIELKQVMAFSIVVTILAGTAFSHPNAIFSTFILVIPLLVEYSIQLISNAKTKSGKLIFFVITIIVVITISIVWVKLTVPYLWKPNQNIVEGIYNWFNTSYMSEKFHVITIAVVAGFIISLVRPKWRFLSFGFLIGAFIYVVCVAYPEGQFRSILTGIWYNDGNRIAAFAVIYAVPLVCVLVDELAKLIPQNYLKQFFAAASIVALIATQSIGVKQSIKNIFETTYYPNPDSSLMDQNKLQLISDISKKVPEDAVIADNPFNGGSLVYALTDRHVLFPMLGTYYQDNNERVIATKLNKVSSDPTVCTAVKAKNIKYVLDFGTNYMDSTMPIDQNPPNQPAGRDFVGYQNLDNSPGFKLEDQKGNAKLYKITACP
ncbi:MAG: hypothetical protein QM571_05985 [Micrococcaceae bacterium]